jgi:hypothetical protein
MGADPDGNLFGLWEHKDRVNFPLYNKFKNFLHPFSKNIRPTGDSASVHEFSEMGPSVQPVGLACRLYIHVQLAAKLRL